MLVNLSNQAMQRVGEIKNQLNQSDTTLLNQYPIELVIKILDSIRVYGEYSSVPHELHTLSAQVKQVAKQTGLDLYYQLVLATLIDRFYLNLDQDHAKIPPSVEAQYNVEFQRILSQFQTNPAGFYSHTNDLFNKDLAICRGKLLPCGAELIDSMSGVPRSLAVKGDVKQFFSVVLCFLVGADGFRPFYEMHLDPRSLRQFNQAGWDRCYLRIADLLLINPEIHGVFGSSWWYDPEIERISPKLAYLRQRPLENGACIFRVGSNQAAVANATKASRIRSDLYQKNQYLPTNYLMVWPRRALLKWACNK